MTEEISKKISSITFGLISPKEIKKMACAKIVTPELYDKEGYPVDGGLMDIRLGVIDPGLRCKTCGERLKECVGHFGYIELARPVIHIKHITTILIFLKYTCRECGHILITEEERTKNLQLLQKIRKDRGPEAYRRRVKEITDSIKNIKKCPLCSQQQYSIKLDKPMSFYENDKKLTPIEIRTRFEKVPDDDVFILGMDPNFARPEWVIYTVFLVPPVTIRPSITLETGERSEDDLTHKLGDIVRINQRLFENINAGAPEIIVEDLWDLLQYHVTTYFDNTIAQIPPARHRSGQPLKTIVERIKSKEGRFRHNLVGKRVNFAARAVISPNSKIKLNEVGIPKEVAMELTVRETVTEWNIEYLKNFVNNGMTIYPGANYIIKPDGKKKKITDDTKQQILEELALGWVVERHIVNGDIALFNRQPSLHRMSLMSHKVRVLPGRSFRLNPAVCAPYNADFDGDEMNLHIPQTEEARAEAEIIMQVQTQIITPKNGYNVIGCIEDAITGNYLLTKEQKMPKEEAIQLLLSVGVENLDCLKKLKSVTDGKDIFSCVLPDDFDFIGTSKFAASKGQENDIVIKNGIMTSGVIDNASIGEGNGALIRAIHSKYDEETTLDILGKIFRLGIAVLLRRGFTLGLSDMDLEPEVNLQATNIINETYKEVDRLIETYKKGELEAVPGKNLEETLEAYIIQALNKVRNKVGTLISKNSKDTSSTVVMANSGAKGNILHLSQISACAGQQALRGKRIEKGYAQRTLSMFKKKDLSPEAHGFIAHGFKKGITPYEFFFHAITGRDSLMDTALRTPKSGYLYRRLSNAFQDIRVEYDNTVRDANKTIIQLKYGDDGIDVSKSEGGTINIKKIIHEVTGK